MSQPSSNRRFFPLPLHLELRNNGHTAVLIAPFAFVEWEDAFEPRVRVEVPAGFETDFHSVPRGLWNFFSPWEYPEAAVVHDFLYRHPGVTRREADRVHRKILEVLGASLLMRWTAWVALRAFGWIPWPERGGSSVG